MLGYKRTHVERRETDVFDPIRTSRSSDRVPESGIPAYHRPQPITNSGDTSAVAVVDYPALKMQVQTLAKRGRSHPQCVGSHASATEIVANVAGGGFAAYLDVRTQGNRQSVTIRPQSGTQGQSHYSWQLGPKRSEPSQRTDFWCRRCSMRTKSLPPILTPRASGSPREQTRPYAYWTRAQARRSARGCSMRTKSLPPLLTPRIATRTDKTVRIFGRAHRRADRPAAGA
jgi:hypothetical protein